MKSTHHPSQAPRGAASLDLPDGLRMRLEQFRRRLWYVKLLEGILAAAFGLLLSYLLVFGLDRLFDTPGKLRIAVLIAGAAGFAILFPLKCHRWIWRQRRFEQVARLLKYRYPRLGDQLLGIVELAHGEQSGDFGRSEKLVRAAMAQVDDRVRDRNLSDAVPDPRHRRWAWAAFSTAVLALTAMIVVPAAGKNALIRWLMPWQPTERYTFTQLKQLEKTRVVPEAEPFDVRAVLSELSRWKPEDAWLRYGEQPRLISALGRAGDYAFTVPPQSEAGELTLKVGDARHHIEISPKPRPELTTLCASLQLPDYLRYDHDPEVEVRGAVISIVKGAQASVSAAARRELAGATVDGRPVDVDGATLITAPQRIDRSGQREFRWRDRDGLEPKAPLTVRVEAVEDARPSISARKLTREEVVLDSEVISFELSAGDDFGVRQVGLEWRGPAAGEGVADVAFGEKIAAAGGPQSTTFETKATFSARREGVQPQTLEIRAFAEDYYPNGERGYSPAFVVHILSPDEHAMWLTDQLGRWFRQSQEVYEQEQLLHESNRQLRGLSSAELDRSGNRRRIEQQAAAERANGQRLGQLTESGEDLIRQALRNEEFDANALERWARMVEQLQMIADHKMPSVAELLKNAAESAGDKPPRRVSENKNLQTRGAETKSDNPNVAPKPQAPAVSDVESGHNQIKPAAASGDKDPKSAGSGQLTLPATQLAGGAQPEPNSEAALRNPSPAQQSMDRALAEQKKLLADFAGISDELQELLSSLEASTFVKRLKAASRRQIEVADHLNQSMLATFGLMHDEIEVGRIKTALHIAEREQEESEKVQVIQSDLEAYFQRKQDLRFKNILTQMKDRDVVGELEKIAGRMTVNHHGRSIISAEYWADHLDRWAEELVSAAQCEACESSGDKASLPPELVLKVMKILHGEIALREETREIENARPEIETSDYRERATSLADTQRELSRLTHEVSQAIQELPDGGRDFAKEVKLLTAASAVMEQSRQLLAAPDTGAGTIAAETEVIELLLQSKRFNPNGGGGGSGSNPGGGGGGTTDDSALARLANGGNRNGVIGKRSVGQATGAAGREFPAEFRNGLDAYFNRLEGGDK